MELEEYFCLREKNWIKCQKINDYEICIWLYSKSSQHEI